MPRKDWEGGGVHIAPPGTGHNTSSLMRNVTMTIVDAFRIEGEGG